MSSGSEDAMEIMSMEGSSSDEELWDADNATPFDVLYGTHWKDFHTRLVSRGGNTEQMVPSLMSREMDGLRRPAAFSSMLRCGRTFFCLLCCVVSDSPGILGIRRHFPWKNMLGMMCGGLTRFLLTSG